MFTRNFYIGIGSAVAGGNSPSASKLSGLKNVSGNSPSAFSNGFGEYWVNLSVDEDHVGHPTMQKVRTSTTNKGGVIFGTGTTPPSLDDYFLSGAIITKIAASVVMSYEYDENGVTATATYTITNTDSASITVGEVGLIASCATNYTGSTGSEAKQKCLLERTVLDDPVTIEPNAIGQVIYSIRMNYPTA